MVWVWVVLGVVGVAGAVEVVGNEVVVVVDGELGLTLVEGFDIGEPAAAAGLSGVGLGIGDRLAAEEDAPVVAATAERGGTVAGCWRVVERRESWHLGEELDHCQGPVGTLKVAVVVQ